MTSFSDVLADEQLTRVTGGGNFFTSDYERCKATIDAKVREAYPKGGPEALNALVASLPRACGLPNQDER